MRESGGSSRGLGWRKRCGSSRTRETQSENEGKKAEEKRDGGRRTSPDPERQFKKETRIHEQGIYSFMNFALFYWLLLASDSKGELQRGMEMSGWVSKVYSHLDIWCKSVCLLSVSYHRRRGKKRRDNPVAKAKPYHPFSNDSTCPL